MDSLDSIWDDPVELENEADSSYPSNPQKKPLFLADSDEEARSSPLRTAPGIDIDIEGIFADVDNDDDEFSFKPLTHTLDTEALRREAEARHKSDLIPLTPHPILTSSLPERTGVGTSLALNAGTGEKREETNGKKERRRPARLDESKLLGPDGFPKLIKEVKNFKIKGKGHEVTDLDRLLRVYGYWTHALYPKTVFRDTVQRIEKICHSKRMNVALSVWRDETYGSLNPEDDNIIDLTDPNANPNQEGSRASLPNSEGVANLSSPSHVPPQPFSSDTGLDDGDDFDIDTVIREEEERMAKERATQSLLKGDEKSRLTADEDGDAAIWEQSKENEKSSLQTTGLPSGNEDDQEVQDGRDAGYRDTVIVQSPSKLLTQNDDEDEDMWDVVRELEAAEAIEPLSILEVRTVPANDDDDFESMYID